MHDLKVFRSQIQQKIDNVANDLNILSMEKEKFETINDNLKNSIYENK